MTTYTPSRSVRTAQYVAAAGIVLMAAVGFAGWLAGDRLLAGAFGSFVAMVPATAVCLGLLGAACVVRVARPHGGSAAVLAAAVGAIVTLELLDRFAGLAVAPDRVFATAAEMLKGQQPGRMSPVTGLCLLALVIAVMLAGSQRAVLRSIAIALSLAVANVAFVLCVAYAYDSPLLYRVANPPPALPTAFGLFVLAMVSATITADRWPMSVLTGDSVRAQLIRAVFPVITGSAVLFAMLDIVRRRSESGQAAALVSAMFVVAIPVAATAMLYSTSGIGRKIDCADTARKAALTDLAESNESLHHMVHDVIEAMAKVVEVRDPYTRGHEQGVATLAVKIAIEMGLSASDVEGIELAALVHDIGKLSVPVEILNKPGKLSDLEFTLIQRHPQYGHDILEDIDFGWPIAEIALQHHERMDGSGYPNGLRGDEILVASRIVACADVVDAMAAHRPYRAALGIDAALQEIVEHPDKYDESVIAAIVRLHEADRLAAGFPVAVPKARPGVSQLEAVAPDIASALTGV